MQAYASTKSNQFKSNVFSYVMKINLKHCFTEMLKSHSYVLMCQIFIKYVIFMSE